MSDSDRELPDTAAEAFGLWPTPEQWLKTARDILDTGTDGQQLGLAQQVLSNAKAAHDCHLLNHAELWEVEKARRARPHTEHSFTVRRDEEADYLRVDPCPCGQTIQSRAMLDVLTLTLPHAENICDALSVTITVPVEHTDPAVHQHSQCRCLEEIVMCPLCGELIERLAADPTTEGETP